MRAKSRLPRTPHKEVRIVESHPSPIGVAQSICSGGICRVETSFPKRAIARIQWHSECHGPV
jgi:hypothetical protein